ncbi:TRAP transporter substrate-binding protein [Mangrovicoccus ximenensis]|uniref:TRAP transporter substrate-binding protein n=1 Tax=Mangrovicoccus ximenensis TaxID=1911570 RepID=UPI000D372775|nr:TRAP transporter substrate-binding protein [Mangrovicoccus ximenensis]
MLSRNFICGALLAAAPVLAPCAMAGTVLQLASVETPQTAWGQAAQRFADGVAEASGGELRVELALSGTTGSPRETLEALTIGTNDIVLTVIASLNPYDPLPGIESYPYLIRDPGHFDRVYNGPVGAELYDEIAKRTGFRMIGAGARGAREMASKSPVNSVEDLKGLKIRVPNIDIFRATWQILGASPTPMSSSEVYTGLQSGIIDAVENPLSAHVRSKYYEAAEYVVMTDHVYGAYTFIFDQARFDSLTDEERAIIEEEGRKALRWGSGMELENAEESRATLEAAGATFLEPDLGPFREKLAAMAGEFPDLAPWVGKIQAVE